MAKTRSRSGPAFVATLIAMTAAGGLSFYGAEVAADYIETRSAADVAEALRLGGYDWAHVRADGLQIHLSGTAPDEVQRFRARSRAETVVEQARVVDGMQVAARASLATPEFEVELLRNDQGISIVGLVPASLDRAALIAALRKDTGAARISDLVETADYPEPDGWDAAYVYGLRAAQLAKRAKISISAGSVEVRAITDSLREKAELETALERARPAGVTLTADVTAPRPIISPFSMRFVKEQSGARFDACAADSEAAQDRIIAAGQKAGIPGKPQCTLALGAPTGQWADAAVLAIDAVSAMGVGSVTISGTDVALFAPASVDSATFDAAVGRLEGALPALFTLTSEQEKKVEAATGPVEFSAARVDDGVQLRGRIADERMRDAVDSLARARFGQVDDALRVDGMVPQGWTLRTIAALEALSGLEDGNVTVTPDLIRLSGVSGSRTASDIAVARLSERLGAGARYELSIRYDSQFDPTVSVPSGIDCVDRLNAAMNESEIGFEPGKSVIAGDPEATLQRIAEILEPCADFRIEVGGHTDSQGSEEMNRELSQSRAEAVLNAIRDHGVEASHMTAKGYGESQPIADNDTEAGREANRRTEFTLLSERPVTQAEIEPPKKTSGVTDPAEVTAAKTAEAARQAATEPLSQLLTKDSAADEVQAGSSEGNDGVDLSGAALSEESLTKVIEALTVPALEAAFPDNRENVVEESEADSAGADLAQENLPEIEPMSPPDFEQAVSPENVE
ncbi:OmpA family protein [Paracoccus sp. MBLB3053]|uniref:OmpA family protein n=1 Tax=Paracoccus aurantius TaxID=3073814 RepID=A0ABU2HNB6_9RHOB|nr:OmpA family protein [Paracoccus sp. MBLB3053]MDS9466527.1 OmpA family protein [Paracoccus sp. MBLB3053]